MSTIIYFDTSALAKWYINETKSDEVEQYIRDQGPVSISDLTVVEMRCLLARRRRERSIDAKMEAEIFATFQEDIRQKFLICHQLPEGWAAGAVNLLSVLSDIPLRTLDALHLAVIKDLTVDILATADNIMVSGAKAMGISVVKF